MMMQVLQTTLDMMDPAMEMDLVDETISGGSGAITAMGAEAMATVDEMFEEEWPLGRYVFIYAMMSWLFAAIPLVIYLFTSTT